MTDASALPVPDQSLPGSTVAPPRFGTLRRLGDRLIYRYPPGGAPVPGKKTVGGGEDKNGDGDGASPVDSRAGLADDEVAVRPVWARPLSGRGREAALLSVEDKEEVAWIPSPDALDGGNRALLLEELADCAVLPRITRVLRTTARFGHRYWKVETDYGPTDFLSRNPENNVIWQDDNRCLIRDVLGNCYEIEDLRALDPSSRQWALRAL